MADYSSNKFNDRISQIQDVTELNKMLDATNDLMERIALEDRLEQLGKKQDLGIPRGVAGSSTTTTTITHTSLPSRPNTMGPTGKRLGSYSLSAYDKPSRVATRPSMMSALGTTKPHPSSSKSSLTPDESSALTPGSVSRPIVRSASQAKEQIMMWAQKCAGSRGIPVKNMTSSFSDGVAFCAIVHHYFPEAFNFEDCLKMSRKERITFAFQKAEQLGGVPQLIEPDDLILMGKKPDYKVMFTYMSEMYRNLKRREMMIPETSES